MHKEITRTTNGKNPKMGESLSTTVTRAAQELSIKYMELKQAVGGAAEPLWYARSKLKDLLSKEAGSVPGVVGEVLNLLEKAWLKLSTHVRKASSMEAD